MPRVEVGVDERGRPAARDEVGHRLAEGPLAAGLGPLLQLLQRGAHGAAHLGLERVRHADIGHAAMSATDSVNSPA